MKMHNARNCIVAGGAGFLGSHLCDRLLGAGHTVTALDDLSTGSEANISHLRDHDRFRFVKHDVLEPYDLEGDWLFNLACPASPPKYQADPVRTTLISVIGTLNGLRLAERRGMRFFQASTSEVYGDPEVHPQMESYVGAVNPIGPRACYDEGKRCAESLCFDFHRRHSVDIRVVRIFNTYGPRMDPEDGRVVSNFVTQALKGLPLTIYGSGQQTRSFCYVDDLVAGFMGMMEQDVDIGPVNIGNAEEFSMLELAKIVKEVIPTTSEIEFRPLPADDPKQRRPDTTRAHEAFGFCATRHVRDGIRATAEDFASRFRTTATVR